MGCGASSGNGKKAQKLELQETKIAAFDEAFQKFEAPTNRLVEMQNNMNEADACINKLEEVEGTLGAKLKKAKIMKDKLEIIFDDLKANKVEFELEEAEGGGIKLVPKGNTEGSQIGQAVEAILGLVEAGVAIITGVPPLIVEITELIQTVVDFPAKAKEEAQNAGLSGMDAMKAVKNTGTNLAQIQNVPTIANLCVATTKELFATLKELCKK